MRHGFMAGVIGLSGMLLVACDKTPEECQRLSLALKANETALKESKSADYKKNPKEAAALARAYVTAVDGEIKQLAALDLTNTRLARYSEDLRATLTEAKTAAERLVVTYEALIAPNDSSCAAEDAWNESGAPVKRACKKGDPTCTQIQVLSEPGTGDRSMADELESYATRLESIAIEDPALKPAVVQRVNRARDYAAALRETGIQAGKVDAISGTYFRAIAKGTPALRDIDRECKR